MRTHSQKIEKQSPFSENPPRASRQASTGVILQRYKSGVRQYAGDGLSMPETAGSSFPVSGSSPVQRESKPNHTGLPDALKSGAEGLSGYSMDDVRVHYNSPEPAQLQALAYTRGTDIHIAPGQEKFLPHETWHVVQQMQGRVRPTMQLRGIDVNDQQGLEAEADTMGARAYASPPRNMPKHVQPSGSVAQGYFYHRLSEKTYTEKDKTKLLNELLKNCKLIHLGISVEEFTAKFEEMFSDKENEYIVTSFKETASLVLNKIREGRIPPVLSDSFPYPAPKYIERLKKGNAENEIKASEDKKAPEESSGSVEETLMGGQFPAGSGASPSAGFDYKEIYGASSPLVTDGTFSAVFRGKKGEKHIIKLDGEEFDYLSAGDFIMRGSVRNHSYEDLLELITPSDLRDLYFMFVDKNYVSTNKSVVKLYVILVAAEGLGRSTHNTVSFFIHLYNTLDKEDFEKRGGEYVKQFKQLFNKLPFTGTGGAALSRSYKEKGVPKGEKKHQFESGLYKSFAKRVGHKEELGKMVKNIFSYLLHVFYNKAEIVASEQKQEQKKKEEEDVHVNPKVNVHKVKKEMSKAEDLPAEQKRDAEGSPMEIIREKDQEVCVSDFLGSGNQGEMRLLLLPEEPSGVELQKEIPEQKKEEEGMVSFGSEDMGAWGDYGQIAEGEVEEENINIGYWTEGKIEEKNLKIKRKRRNSESGPVPVEQPPGKARAGSVSVTGSELELEAGIKKVKLEENKKEEISQSEAVEILQEEIMESFQAHAPEEMLQDAPDEMFQGAPEEILQKEVMEVLSEQKKEEEPKE